MHECLRSNLDKISDACRKEEITLSVLQASNTELMPNIANACKVCLLPGLFLARPATLADCRHGRHKAQSQMLYGDQYMGTFMHEDAERMTYNCHPESVTWPSLQASISHVDQIFDREWALTGLIGRLEV